MATQKRSPNPKGSPSGDGGKEQRFTVEQVRAALEGSGGLVTSAAAKLNCARATIYDYMERFPELKNIRKDADELVSDLAEANVMNAVRGGNIGISQWWLNQKARHRGFGDRMVHENDPDNPVGIPLQSKVTIKIVRSKHAPSKGQGERHP